MRTDKQLTWVALLLVSAGVLLAEDEAGEQTPGTASGGPAPARVFTRAGDVLLGQVGVAELRVATDYGVLTVPLAEVERVDLGVSSDEATRARLAQLVRDVVRAKPGDEGGLDSRVTLLSRAGVFALAVIDEAKTDAARREDESATKALDALAAAVREIVRRQRRDPLLDTVVTSRFTIRGRVELTTLEVKSRYGVARVPRSALESVVWKGDRRRDATDRVLVIKSWTDTTGEYQTVHQILDKRTRLRLIEFTGMSAGDLRRALRRHQVLVIPELEKAGNSAEVARGASKALRSFVRSGGVVVSCGGSGNIRFLSESGLLKCTGGSSNSEANVRRRHAILRGVGGSLPHVNATFPIQVEGRVKALATGSTGNVVCLARLGEGAVVYLGWDFYQSEESHQKVLANAVNWAASGGAEAAERR